MSPEISDGLRHEQATRVEFAPGRERLYVRLGDEGWAGLVAIDGRGIKSSRIEIVCDVHGYTALRIEIPFAAYDTTVETAPSVVPTANEGQG